MIHMKYSYFHVMIPIFVFYNQDRIHQSKYINLMLRNFYLIEVDILSILECSFNWYRIPINKKFIQNLTKHLYRKSPYNWIKIHPLNVIFSLILIPVFNFSLFVLIHQQNILSQDDYVLVMNRPHHLNFILYQMKIIIKF